MIESETIRDVIEPYLSGILTDYMSGDGSVVDLHVATKGRSFKVTTYMTAPGYRRMNISYEMPTKHYTAFIFIDFYANGPSGYNTLRVLLRLDFDAEKDGFSYTWELKRLFDTPEMVKQAVYAAFDQGTKYIKTTFATEVKEREASS